MRAACTGALMELNAKIYVAGHRGLVGSAIVKSLEARGYTHIIRRTHAELDLTDAAATEAFFAETKPDYVFLAAAKVGGIVANNTYPAEFIRDNLAIQNNVIHAAWKHRVRRLLFLGSSCIYPKMAPQPMKEAHLLTGPLEPTNRPYALAKIAGIEMCWSYNRQYGTKYLAVMPTNLYGPGDNYHLQNSHVIPAMIRKFHLAKLAMDGDLAGIIADEARHGAITPDVKAMIGLDPNAPITPASTIAARNAVTMWGTGTPYREFLYSEDMANACTFIMSLPDDRYEELLWPAGPDSSNQNLAPLVNIGVGEDITIRELAELVKDVIGYRGQIEYDTTKPDGTPRKLMDVSRLKAAGFVPVTGLREGLMAAFNSYMGRA